ncbi:MAG: nucleotidyl transferase AbiEii/AbiGii toxin family protein [Bacteroidota bacterium]
MGQKSNLSYDTVSLLLLNVLKTLMFAKEFESFRLVGGTALSLQKGHRESHDIDLFTAAEYGSVNFEAIKAFLRSTYAYVDTSDYKIIGMGTSYYVGNDKNDCIKLDLFYTDPFIEDAACIDGIRMATIGEIIAMKLDVVSRIGRKKDFWDIHELTGDYSMEEMLGFHQKRYPFFHERELIIRKLSDFTQANDDFDPICLKGKHWEIIKLDLLDFVKNEGNAHFD